MKRRQIMLYNLAFTIWILWTFPITWLIVLPLNFGIDLCVTALILKKLNQEHICSKVKNQYEKHGFSDLLLILRERSLYFGE